MFALNPWCALLISFPLPLSSPVFILGIASSNPTICDHPGSTLALGNHRPPCHSRQDRTPAEPRPHESTIQAPQLLPPRHCLAFPGSPGETQQQLRPPPKRWSPFVWPGARSATGQRDRAQKCLVDQFSRSVPSGRSSGMSPKHSMYGILTMGQVKALAGPGHFCRALSW